MKNLNKRERFNKTLAPHIDRGIGAVQGFADVAAAISHICPKLQSFMEGRSVNEEIFSDHLLLRIKNG